MTVRAPRCWLEVKGTRVPCLEARVTRKATRNTDTFSARLSITASERVGGPALADWADYQPSDVSIVFATEPGGGDAVTMITGEIDKPEIHWINHTVVIQGRDKSASLLEKKRSEKFQNQKSGEIVKKIAQDHGLQVQADDGDDFAGQVYSQDNAHLAMNRTDHEILSDLADREGFRWYVEGTTLYFEPKDQGDSTFVAEWVPPRPDAPAVASILELRTHRNMTAAKKHKSHAKSWHHGDKRRYEHEESLGGVGDREIETHHHHNGRRQPQTEKLARSRLKNATRHDCGVDVKAVGDLAVTPRMKLQLVGTGTIYDQTYEIDSVDFHMAWERGFVMDICGKAPKQGRDKAGKSSPGSTTKTAA